MNKKKHPDYTWVWLVVGVSVPIAYSLFLFSIAGDNRVLGIGAIATIISLLTLLLLFYPLYFKRKPIVRGQK